MHTVINVILIGALVGAVLWPNEIKGHLLSLKNNKKKEVIHRVVVKQGYTKVYACEEVPVSKNLKIEVR